jgi:hypothetical protein
MGVAAVASATIEVRDASIRTSDARVDVGEVLARYGIRYW